MMNELDTAFGEDGVVGFGEEGGAGFGEGLVGSVSGDGRSMTDLRSIESVCTMDPSSSCTFDTATPNMAT